MVSYSVSFLPVCQPYSTLIWQLFLLIKTSVVYIHICHAACNEGWGEEEREREGERDGGEGERDGRGGEGWWRGGGERERDGEGGEGKMETVRPRSVLTISMCHKANRETFHPAK